MGLLWWSTALIGVLTAVVYVMYRLVAPSAVRVVAGAGALRDHVLAHCPSLQSRYLPALFAWNGHLMAIIATTMHKQQRVPLRREELTLPDGGAVALDWVLYGNTDEAQHHEQDDGLDQDAATRPVVLFLHGLVGSSKVNYMQHTLDHLIRCLTKKQQQEQQDGSGAPPAASSLGHPPHHWRLVVMNARGCGGTRLRSPRGFHAGDTDDVRYVVQLLHERFPRAPLMAVSFSLGANILTKYLGEEADKSVLHAAVAVSNPWNLSQTDIHMRSTSLYRLYNRKMCGTLVDWYRSHQYAFDGLVEPKTVFDAKTIRDFDAAMVVPLYNVRSPRCPSCSLACWLTD